jgi:serine-type D-Ala-D-Ala carboxypeptidase
LDIRTLRQLLASDEGGTIIVAARVTRGGDEILGAGIGDLDVDPRQVLFDLASLTKLITATRLLQRVADGDLELEASARTTVSGALQRVADVRLDSLLAFRGGFPPDVPLHEIEPFASDPDAGERLARSAVLSRLTDSIEQTRRKSRSIRRYNNISYVILGEALAAHDGWSGVNGELAAMGFPTLRYRCTTPLHRLPAPGEVIAPTEYDSWRGRRCHGEVHDETAYLLGGIAGHAGAFGAIDDVCALARRWMLGPPALDIRQTDWERLTTARPASGPFRRVSEYRPAAVEGLPQHALGVTGFTGTSIWIDFKACAAVVLLTNRVVAGRTSIWIDEVRRRVHTAWLEASRR